MIYLLVSYLPYLFILYFLYRAIKEPVFFMGIPFLIFFRTCIFFETVTIFVIPYGTSPEIILIAWTAIFWIVFLARSEKRLKDAKANIFRNYPNSLLDYSVYGLMMISVWGLFSALREYFSKDFVINEFIVLISLFLGYMIIRSVTINISLKTLSNFLFSIVMINTAASFLYILHQGLHIPIYKAEEFTMEIVQGEIITRTFWFMPVLSFASIAYLLVLKNLKSLPIIGMLAINIFGVFISYTRSYLIIVVLIIIIYFILVSIKKRDYYGLAKNMIISMIVGVVFYIGVSTYLPANTSFFIERFTSIKENIGDEESNSMLFRFARTSEIVDRIDNTKMIFGFGPVTENQLPFVENMRATTADMVWTGVIFRWGYVGFILFLVLYFSAVYKAYQLFIRNDGILSNLGLFILLILMSQLVEGFTSWTFLGPARFGLGLWYFGILSGIIFLNDRNMLTSKIETINE